jgi:type II secretory pathway component GspD/PulD (secretin)
MKTKLAILFVVGLSTWGLPAPAQAGQQAQKADVKPADDKKDAAPDEPGDYKYDEIGLFELIANLARLADMNVLLDPALQVLDANQKPIEPVVRKLRLTGVTARQALEEVLNNHSLQIVENPKTKISRVTKKDPAQLKYTSPTNLVAVFAATFPTPSRAKMTPDVRTSKVAISATEKEWQVITNLIEQLDTPTKQVLIEARIMETSKNPQSLKGIDWSGTLQAQAFGWGNGQTVGSTTRSFPGQTVSSSVTDPGGRTITSTTTTPATETTTLNTAIGGLIPGISANTLSGFSPATAFLTADGVRGVLSFLNTDADTEVVATPRSVVLDNEMAKLSVTRAFPIFTTSPGSANTPATTQVTYTNVGTILEVTPRITAANNISLKVSPEVSNIDGKDRSTASGQVNEANIYALRRIDTRVTIPSGHTLVMGGLVSDNHTKNYTKIPLLGDIPGMGKYLFSRETKNRTKSNLLIFITPTIVADNDYQPTQTDFLKTKMIEKPDFDDSAWDSGKPKDWKKKPY